MPSENKINKKSFVQVPKNLTMFSWDYNDYSGFKIFCFFLIFLETSIPLSLGEPVENQFLKMGDEEMGP